MKWRFETGDKVFSSPTVMNGTVYVGSDNGRLYAVNTEKGAKKWHFEIHDQRLVGILRLNRHAIRRNEQYQQTMDQRSH